jgi:hypothetical protein
MRNIIHQQIPEGPRLRVTAWTACAVRGRGELDSLIDQSR